MDTRVSNCSAARWRTRCCVPEIPHTATGKMQKLKLRELFKDHQLPSA